MVSIEQCTVVWSSVVYIFQAIHATRWDLRIWRNLNTIQSFILNGILYDHIFIHIYTNVTMLTLTYACNHVWTSRKYIRTVSPDKVFHMYKVFELHLMLAKKRRFSTPPHFSWEFVVVSSVRIKRCCTVSTYRGRARVKEKEKKRAKSLLLPLSWLLWLYPLGILKGKHNIFRV